ncbi:MAG: RNA methyltransferase [Verrucomicrobiota bacterium]|jgi:tRNA G18 (ribose-2'-O)-methylase SpoU
MFRVQTIDNLDLPELQPYRTLRRSQEHCDQGMFVAEGEKVVRRLLESTFTVVSVLLPDKWLADFEPALRARPEQDIPVFVVTEKRVLEQLIGFSMFQGVLAVGKIPAHSTLTEVLDRSSRPRLLAAIEGLTNAENLGALVRNCAAFQVQALIVGETSGSPFLRRAVRNSMGTLFQLPVVEASNLVQTLRALRAAGVRCIAAHPRAGGRSLCQADFTGDCCIVFGSEGYGITPAALGACDEAVAIPMPPTVDSLNVASATAVFFYEVSRQRIRADAPPRPAV